MSASRCFSSKFSMHIHNHQFLKSHFWCIYLGNYVYTYKENARQSKAISRLLSLVQMCKPWCRCASPGAHKALDSRSCPAADWFSAHPGWKVPGGNWLLSSYLATVNLTHWESVVVCVFSSFKTRRTHLPCFSGHLKTETWHWSHVKAYKLHRHCVLLWDLGLWRAALFYWVIIYNHSLECEGWAGKIWDQKANLSSLVLGWCPLEWLEVRLGAARGRMWARTGLHWRLAHLEESPQATRCSCCYITAFQYCV